jgi:hypothetical protein
MKVMGRCWKLAAAENIRLRRSYRRELKKTLRVIRFSKSQDDKKKTAAVIRRVKTMTNALLRDVERKLGHLKQNFRLARNCLKGFVGDAVNLLLAAAAFNYGKWMNALVQGLFFAFFVLAAITDREDKSLRLAR